jgi:hypothetical protein
LLRVHFTLFGRNFLRSTDDFSTTRTGTCCTSILIRVCVRATFVSRTLEVMFHDRVNDDDADREEEKDVDAAVDVDGGAPYGPDLPDNDDTTASSIVDVVAAVKVEPITIQTTTTNLDTCHLLYSCTACNELQQLTQSVPECSSTSSNDHSSSRSTTTTGRVIAFQCGVEDVSNETTETSSSTGSSRYNDDPNRSKQRHSRRTTSWQEQQPGKYSNSRMIRSTGNSVTTTTTTTTILYESCTRTDAEYEFSFVQFQVFVCILGLLSLLSIRKQKLYAASLFDQRRMATSNSSSATTNTTTSNNAMASNGSTTNSNNNSTASSMSRGRGVVLQRSNTTNCSTNTTTTHDGHIELMNKTSNDRTFTVEETKSLLTSVSDMDVV